MKTFLTAAFLFVIVRDAAAQAWAYPSFQPSRITVREYNIGVGDADSRGVVLVFQWREQAGAQSQFGFDLGMADADARGTQLVLFGGISGATRLGSATSEVPLDFLLTGGAYLAVGNGTLVRIPVGVSVGHRFEFAGNLALTPYLHPRLSLDLASRRRGGTDLGLTFDLGANFEASRTLSIRGAMLFTGTDSFDGEGFGISLAWTPPSLNRKY